jgi:hypothetical protein
MVRPYVKSFITNRSLHDLRRLGLCCNVMVTNPTHKTMITNVTSQPIGATVKFNVITKIHKYKGFYERHHFYSNGHGGACRT